MKSRRTEIMRQLLDTGIRPSAQRIAIMEYISACECHPTADEVYSALVREHPTLSRTTVFSCLKLLAEKGILNDIDISAESTRCDSAHRATHAHFMCRDCHRIFDIPFDLKILPAPADFECDNVNVFSRDDALNVLKSLKTTRNASELSFAALHRV